MERSGMTGRGISFIAPVFRGRFVTESESYEVLTNLEMVRKGPSGA